MLPLAATDTVSLALERTKRMLFRPFRLSLWWRMAVLAFFTGEISGGGGFPNLNYRTGVDHPSLPAEIKSHIGLVIAAAVVVAGVLFVFVYIASVLHFVLFEAVLTGTTRIRDGWRRWRERGRSYFAFNLLMLVLQIVIAAVIAVPAYLAYRAGVFSTSHLGVAILFGLALAAIGLALFLTLTIVALMTKDFVIPIMMFEGVNVMDGWRRAWPMIKAEGKRYAGFYGLKLVLRIATGVLFSILVIVLILFMAIPAVIVIALAVPGTSGGGPGAAVFAVILVLLLLVMLPVFLLVMATIGVPIAVFFTSYALQFFGSRYEPLRMLVYPEPPPMPPPVVPVIPVAPVPPPIGA